MDLLCEPVEPLKGELEHIHYFCGNTEIPSDLKDHEPQRVALYRGTASLMRAYANIADELEPAGYSAEDVARIKWKLEQYLNARDIVRRASGEVLDLKPYEADMRHLIDTYIEASEPRKISPFEDIGLLDLIVKTGIANAIAAHLGSLKGNRAAIAETIENNLRNVIIRDRLTDPAYYEKMSTLLDEIIAARKAKAIEYEEYLKRMGELAEDVTRGHSGETPTQLDTPGKRALYNNLRKPPPDGSKMEDEAGSYVVDGEVALHQALEIDAAVKRVRHDDWRGHQPRELIIKRALFDILKDVNEVERIFKIIFQQHEY
jgi:type I restriction enzyme, R subunit